MRGPYCEAWPVYHAVYDTDTGTIYAAAASEWHGSSVWRSRDLGETWEQSSEGLSYVNDDGRKISKVSTLSRAAAACSSASRRRGSSRAATTARRGRSSRRSSGQPGSEEWDDPANQPPGHLGISDFADRPDDRTPSGRSCRESALFETEDGGTSWTPRNRGPARRLAAPSARRSASACTSSSVRPTRTACTSRTTSACTAARTAASVGEITEGLPATSALPRLRTRATPRRSTCCRSTAARPHAARRQGRGLAHARRRLALAGMRTGLPQENAFLTVLRQAMAVDQLDARPLFRHPYRALFASADEGDRWARSPATCRRSARSRSRYSTDWRTSSFPETLTPLFPGLPRRVDVDAATVRAAIDRSTTQWPGLRDRICEPGPAMRRHIHVYVDRERAGSTRRSRRARAST